MNIFFHGKKVFITGHTGFKGTWLTRLLVSAGAAVTGYSLSPVHAPNIFELSGVEPHIHSIIGDIRDKKALESALIESKAEIVIHMAAQPLVLEGYNDPAYTYDVNVMGTVNILESIRNSSTVRSFLNVTTDKVYDNQEWNWGYRETDRLGGNDPYSNSKACSELVTETYRKTFFKSGPSISTARAGNVIGGGDFSENRILPDCIKASLKKESIALRNPYSVRPYQHVLDALFAYLLIVEKQYHESTFAGSYNIGPDHDDMVSTVHLAKIFCDHWGNGASYVDAPPGESSYPEAHTLLLDCSRMRSVFGWKPVWDIETAVLKTIEWTQAYLDSQNIWHSMELQINAFSNDRNAKEITQP